MNPEAVEASNRLFNLLTLAGALFLWLGFFMLGVIARRYEIVFKKWTGWKGLMLAPSGILVYVLFIVAQFIPWKPSEAASVFLEYLAYGSLLVSAVACLVLTDRFHRFIHNILSPRDPKGA